MDCLSKKSSSENVSYRDLMNGDHIWACLKKNASFLVKRKGGKPTIFSRDPLNMINKHSPVYSGFLSEKALGIESRKDNKGIVILIKNQSEEFRNKPFRLIRKVSFSSYRSFSFISRHLRSFTMKKSYRPDLQKIALLRARLLLSSQIHKKSFSSKKSRKNKNITQKV
ncbi:hypothetical protein PCANB_000639 [Pneumocystis canis]|nr:hypothetical protein PCANB_000639 [Pneumocystis canis]